MKLGDLENRSIRVEVPFKSHKCSRKVMRIGPKGNSLAGHGFLRLIMFWGPLGVFPFLDGCDPKASVRMRDRREHQFVREYQRKPGIEQFPKAVPIQMLPELVRGFP